MFCPKAYIDGRWLMGCEKQKQTRKKLTDQKQWCQQQKCLHCNQMGFETSRSISADQLVLIGSTLARYIFIWAFFSIFFTIRDVGMQPRWRSPDVFCVSHFENPDSLNWNGKFYIYRNTLCSNSVFWEILHYRVNFNYATQYLTWESTLREYFTQWWSLSWIKSNYDYWFYQGTIIPYKSMFFNLSLVYKHSKVCSVLHWVVHKLCSNMTSL